MWIRRVLAAVLLPLALLIAPPAQRADAAPEACDGWVVEYALAPGSQLKIEDTPFGAGNGTYALGPGTLALRFRDKDGKPLLKGKVSVAAYSMHAHVPVTTNVLGMKTTVTSDTKTTVTADRCGKVASGLFKRTQLVWTTPFRHYRTDGTITCHGALCGRFGAPPEGKSEIHIPPRPVRMMALDFKGDDAKHFTSDFFMVEKTDSPRSTNYMRLVGHEVSRRCEKTPTCG